MRKPLLTFAALVLAAAPAAAAPKLETVLARHFEAMGGLGRLRALTSVTVAGTDTWDGKPTRFVTTRARPNLMRYEASGPEGTMVKAFDGKQLWFAKDGKAELAPAAKTGMMKAKAEFDDVLMDWEKKGHKVTLVGEENGAYVIDIALAGGDSQRRFIEAKSFLEVKRVMTFTYDGVQKTKTMTFSDYRTTAGIPSPHVWEVEHDGKKGRTVIDEIRWNGKVDLASFAPPKDAVAAAAK